MCDTLVHLDGDTVLFAKNSDRDPNEAQLLEWRPARSHPPGTTVDATWISIPQAASTRALLLSRPWWMWGAEMGANDAGVVIGNEAVFTRRHEAGPGLLGMDLLRLALERAGDRHGAVGVIVDLLERHGQGGSCSIEHPRFSYDNSFMVADPDGATVLETAGRSWATEEVTGPGRSISNGLTIDGFARSHADPLRGRVAQCSTRRRRTESAARRATGVADLAAALRSHGEGAGPEYRRTNGAMSAPCMHAGGLLAASQTTASWISEVRAGPRALHWATATAAPCTSLFKPFRVHEPVECGPVPSGRSDGSMWWRHEHLHRAVMTDPLGLLARFGAERDRVERAWFDDPPSGAAAWAQAEVLLERWTDDVVAGLGRDHRPWWLRRYWGRQDRNARRAAAAPGPPTGGGTGPRT